MHERFRLTPRQYLVATFHRPSNVDTTPRLRDLLDLVRYATQQMPLVWPLHPRTRHSLQRAGLLKEFQGIKGLILTEPLGYLEFLSLVSQSRAVVTDSGGIQEETTYLRIPCITMRDNTERPATVDVGSNVLAGSLASGARRALEAALSGGERRGAVPPLWDGRTGGRVAAIMKEELSR